VAEVTGISIGSCNTILKEDLRLQWFSMEFMPRLLTEDREFSAFQFVKISSDE
jgi:hypothetical protein